MGDWPEFEVERLAGALLRVDLYEQRYLTVGEYHNVVNHLLRSASAACLSDREDEAERLIARCGQRVVEWIRATQEGRAKPTTWSDLACARGWLAVAISAPVGATEAARTFVAVTARQPTGCIHNARVCAAAVLGDFAEVEASCKLAELSDAGLGLPLKRFALALVAQDQAGMHKALQTWLNEKMEATMTHEWGAYNEVPIEVSGALALATRAGIPILFASNRVLTRFRA